jgi:RNA polymerase sigma factor (sigma-70 family)
MSEEEIVTGICIGGRHRCAALRAWITGPVGKRMQRFFISKGVAEQDAEDVLQDTIMSVVTKAHTYRADGEAGSWMWQIARNCMADFFRKSGSYQKKSPLDSDAAASDRLLAANDAVVSLEDGVRVTKLPYVASAENARSSQSAPRQVLLDEEQWRALEESTAGDCGDAEVDSVDECFGRGMDAFIAQMPERGLALNLQLDGASVSKIAAQLGRTVAATKEYLSQCRKHLQPFIANCTDLLST